KRSSNDDTSKHLIFVLGLVIYYHSVNGSVFRKYNRISGIGIDDVICRCLAIRGCITYGM
ncbi:MAG TPA: hypothetical protein VKA92_11465, partial [Segetibacter sp.]|nr:hypothetical protein [Segetibacter sp.]